MKVTKRRKAKSAPTDFASDEVRVTKLAAYAVTVNPPPGSDVSTVVAYAVTAQEPAEPNEPPTAGDES